MRALEASRVNASSSSDGLDGFIAAVSVGTGGSASPRSANDVAYVISAAFGSNHAALVLEEATNRVRANYAPASNVTTAVYSLRVVEVCQITVFLFFMTIFCTNASIGLF